MAALKRAVNLIGRKRDSEHNVVVITCDLFDMNAYVTMLKKCWNDDDKIFDYIIVEPVAPYDLFSENLSDPLFYHE